MPPNSGTITARRPHQQQQNKNHNNNDLKSLRAQFRHSLSSLTELFPEWSQDDLLFVMDECQGDLDLAITRISEGYANQWGQVKSKKPNIKKTMTHKPNGEPFSNRGGKSKGNGKNIKNKKSKREKTKETTTQPVPEDELKPSWASIAKGPINPEEAVVTAVRIEKENVVVSGQVFDQTTANKVAFGDEAVELVAVDEQVSKGGAIKEEFASEQVITVEAVKEEIIGEENIHKESIDEENTYKESIEEQATMELIKEEATNESNNEKKDFQEEKKESGEEKEHKEQLQVLTTIKRKSTAIRRLNQVEAVVLPGNQQEAIASLSCVNVQFGSLNLNQGSSDSEIEEEVNETVIQQKEQEPASKEVLVEKKPVIPQMTKESIQPQAVAQAPINQPQAVAPPPNQPVLQESYTSASYSTFVPNTMSAYHHGIIAPTSTAEYTVYNPEPQRMNYYDPNLYHSPSVNTREKYNTPPPIPIVESTIIHHQPQPFNHNTNSIPYYYSYYNNQPQQPQQNYQPIGYQTYVNKTLYNPPITTTAATTISTAAAATAPPPLPSTVAPVTNPMYTNKSNNYEYHHHNHHSYEEQQQQQQVYYNQQQQQTEMMYHQHHYQPQPYFAYNNNTSNHLPQPQQQHQQQPVFQQAPPPPPQRQPYWHQA